MKKLVLLLLTFVACLSYGQNKEVYSLQSSIKKECNKQVIGNLTVFVNPVSSKGIVPLSAKSRNFSKENSIDVLKTTFNVYVNQSGDYYFLANTLSTYV